MYKRQILSDVTLYPKRFRTTLITAANTFLFKYLVSYYTCEFFRQQLHQARNSTKGLMPITSASRQFY